MIVNFELGENAKLPTKENETDAGYDLYSAEEVVIESKQRKLVKTNLIYEPVLSVEELELFKKFNMTLYASIRDRSGNALKLGLTVLGGVVDYNYRNIIGVILYNTSEEPISIEVGSKIAQLIFTPCFIPKIQQVLFVNKETDRGQNGFGSSGVIGQ